MKRIRAAALQSPIGAPHSSLALPCQDLHNDFGRYPAPSARGGPAAPALIGHLQAAGPGDSRVHD